MLKMKDAFEQLEKQANQLTSVNGYYYESNFTKGDMEELRNTLAVLNEKLPADERISRALELINYDTSLDKLVTMKEVELSDIEENGIQDPDSYDSGSLISEKTEEKYYILFQDARTELEELKQLMNEICISE